MKRKKCKSCGRLFERRFIEKDCSDCVKLDNKNKIIKHGFDLKYSFRKRVRKTAKLKYTG